MSKPKEYQVTLLTGPLSEDESGITSPMGRWDGKITPVALLDVMRKIWREQPPMSLFELSAMLQQGYDIVALGVSPKGVKVSFDKSVLHPGFKHG